MGTFSDVPLGVSALVCAYNEEKNLPHLLRALLAGREPGAELREVVVVASGCTDRTLEVLREFASRDPRVRPVIQPTRLGKASAMSLGLGIVSEELILVENADTLPEPGAISVLVRSMNDPQVSLVCSHPVPSPDPPGFTADVGRVLWEVHHHLCMMSPKVGEAFLVRAISAVVPADIEDDDTFIGAYAAQHHGRRDYAPGAVIVNRVPSRLRELLSQRLRINRQVFRLRRRTAIQTASWEPALMAKATMKYLRERPERLLHIVVLTFVELTCRSFAVVLAAIRPRPLHLWPQIASTKTAIETHGTGNQQAH